MYLKNGEHHVPAMTFASETLVFDRKRNMQVLRLDGAVFLPIGAEVELTHPNVNATVVGVRLLAGLEGVGDDALPMKVCLDVDVPTEWWESTSRV
jgi:hypothetical protein